VALTLAAALIERRYCAIAWIVGTFPGALGTTGGRREWIHAWPPSSAGLADPLSKAINVPHVPKIAPHSNMWTSRFRGQLLRSRHKRLVVSGRDATQQGHRPPLIRTFATCKVGVYFCLIPEHYWRSQGD
jgi:hypothetical protein